MKNRKKLIVLFLSCVVVVLTGFFFINHRLKKQMHQVQMQHLSQELNLLIRAKNLSNENNWQIEYFEEVASLITPTQQLTFFDPNGKVLFQTAPLSDVHQVEDNLDLVAILTMNTEFGFSAYENSDIFSYAQSVVDASNRIGIIRLTEPLKVLPKLVVFLQIFFFILVMGLLIWIFLLLDVIRRKQQQPLEDALPILQEFIEHPENQQMIHQQKSDWTKFYDSLNVLMQQTNQLYYQQLFSEEKLTLILENLTIGIIIMSDHKINQQNPISEQLLFEHPGIQTAISEMKQELDVALETIQKEWHFTFPVEKNIKIVLKPLRFTEEKIKEYVVVLYDLTEIRKLEQIHEDFIRNISHELKTPTTSIIGFTETLLDGAMDDPQNCQQFLSIIQKESSRLYSLIQNILLLSRKKDFWDESLLTLVSVKEMLITEVNHYQPILEQKNLHLVEEVAGEVENCSLPQEYFQPIIKNILENAIEYTPEDGNIKIKLVRTNQQLVMTCIDDGIGIEPAEQKRIFEKFYRVSKSRQRKVGGSGLGLAIVAHYVELLEGTIQLTSQLNEGTMIKISFPLK